MSRSSISDAARADDNLLRIADWCERHHACFAVQRNTGAREGRAVVVVVESAWGSPRFAWAPGDIADNVHIDTEHRLCVGGKSAPDAFGRTVDALERFPAPVRPNQESEGR